MALIVDSIDGQTFHIGDDIKITVYINQPDQVKLAIDLPKDLSVLTDVTSDKTDYNLTMGTTD